MLSWAIVTVTALVPLNWIRLWASGDIPKDATLMQFLLGTAICWSISAGLAYFLIISARGIKIREAKDEQAMQVLLAQPLTEIRPSVALIKSGERAFCAVGAELLKQQTVGFTANTSGVSVRVAKGVTLRTSGTKGKAVKGMVNVSSGELVVTDQRIIFSGDRKSFSIPLENLLNSTNYADGFGFSDSKSTYTLRTANDKERLQFAIALQKVIRS